jgi:hypothetical protein
MQRDVTGKLRRRTTITEKRAKESVIYKMDMIEIMARTFPQKQSNPQNSN